MKKWMEEYRSYSRLTNLEKLVLSQFDTEEQMQAALPEAWLINCTRKLTIDDAARALMFNAATGKWPGYDEISRAEVLRSRP